MRKKDKDKKKKKKESYVKPKEMEDY